MNYESLKTRWWYRLIQVVFGLLLVTILLVSEFVIFDSYKPVKYISDKSYIKCNTNEMKEYDLSYFPLVLHPDFDSVTLPDGFDVFAANLCHYQQFDDSLRDKRSKEGDDSAYLFAYNRSKTDEGRRFIRTEMETNGTSTFLDKALSIYQVDKFDYKKDESVPLNYFSFNKVVAHTNSYMLLILYMILDIVIVLAVSFVVRSSFLYVVCGKFVGLKIFKK